MQQTIQRQQMAGRVMVGCCSGAALSWHYQQPLVKLEAGQSNIRKVMLPCHPVVFQESHYAELSIRCHRC
jgi:hypothetical protein